MNNLIFQMQEEIRHRGPLSFARFMELALYAPGLGYYERRRDIGPRGDFFTSVNVGPLFGELLAFQFAQWAGDERQLQIVEAGAHDGALAADILSWMRRRRPGLDVGYCLIEPSPIHRDWQEQKLRDWRQIVKWATDVSEIGPASSCRIIFCNEFLDAMPAHRLAWNGKGWDECFVACNNGRFVWQQSSPTPELAGSLRHVGPELAAVLPVGFVIEHSPAAVAWWNKAATALGRGKLLTADYGLAGQEQFRPERPGGTLRAYRKHHIDTDVLADPGEQDITAHVNFSAIEEAGRAAGLVTDQLVEQGRFLTQILAQTEAQPGGFDAWTPTRARQFQTLIHPEHLGRVFRVLIQSR